MCIRDRISIVAMFSMMGGKNAKILAEYQAALDRITKAEMCIRDSR